MLASVVIAAHNEGKLLALTVASTIEATQGIDCEIVIADDASSDGSVAKTVARFPSIRVVSRKRRRGCSATKDFGARAARGDVLVFLDGHTKPERFAIERLVRAVIELDGKAVVTPRVPALDVERWENRMFYAGYGFRADLETLEGRWIGLDAMRPHGRFHETPALVGCALAVTRDLYERLGGFDVHMLQWGVEDVDFGLKAWLMGFPVLHDRTAIVGHRFRASFDNFTVTAENVLVNQMRLARKNFTDAVWADWVERFRGRAGETTWRKVARVFTRGEKSVEAERERLLASRVHDEHWYAKRFGLSWPIRERAARGSGRSRRD